MTVREPAVEPPSVTVGYYSKTPSHYVARLGRSGWLEGWGWTIEEAVASLAAVVAEQQPPFVMDQTGPDKQSILAWLLARAPAPTLSE